MPMNPTRADVVFHTNLVIPHCACIYLYGQLNLGELTLLLNY